MDTGFSRRRHGFDPRTRHHGRRSRPLPERLGPLGARVEADLRARLVEAPSFVAFEGYDTVAVLAEVLRSSGSWPDVAVEGHAWTHPVLPHAGHQRLAVDVAAGPGR